MYDIGTIILDCQKMYSCYSLTMSLQNKPRVIAIVGPTASGKTSLSIDLATRFNGEIISADSRQVYRDLDIGTAKVTPEEMAGVPHHLIDIIDLATTFSAHDFKERATVAIEDIHKRGKVPIIVGGTFFYLDQLRGRSGVAAVPRNPALRATLESLPLLALHARVAAYDTALLKTLDQSNPRRLVRALEILEALGHIPEATVVEDYYTWLVLSLTVPKDTLRARYADRAQAWLEAGFLDEIKRVLSEGVSIDRLREIGFEYTLGLTLLRGEITREEFITQFVQKNWQYAKRQQTWLKRDASILSVDPTDQSSIISTVNTFLQD
jgi:tRNA dimethylallyltransferase